MEILKNYSLTKEEIILKLLDVVKTPEKKVVRPRPSIKKYKYIDDYPLDNQLINQFGGNTKLAEILKISPMAISRWRKSGIPENRLLELAYRYDI
jgi:hypothetical protein